MTASEQGLLPDLGGEGVAAEAGLGEGPITKRGFFFFLVCGVEGLGLGVEGLGLGLVLGLGFFFEEEGEGEAELLPWVKKDVI